MKFAGQPSPKMREIYRAAAAKHPDPAIRALVEPCAVTGVLPRTEQVAVPGLPKRCQVIISLCEHQGCWHYGWQFESPASGSSGPAKTSSAKWTARWGALDSGLRQAIRWFEAERQPAAVRVLTAFAEAQPDRFTGALADQEHPAHQVSFGRLDPEAMNRARPTFRDARAPQLTTPNSQLETPVPMSKSAAPTPSETEPWIPFDERPVEHADPRKLSIDPYVEKDPYLDRKDPRLRAKQRGWKERKTCKPLLVSPRGVVSGRHSLREALDNEWKTIPIRRITLAEVVEAADKDFFAHHRMSASVRNYFAAPKLEHHYREAQERHIAILQSGGKKVPPPVTSIEALAKELDLSPEYLRIARNLHEAFANPAKFVIGGKKTTLRDHFEPRLLCDAGVDKDGTKLPLSLGDAWKGVSYFLKSGAGEAGNPSPKVIPARNTFLHNFKTAGRNLAKAAKGWDRWTANERELVVDAFAESFAQLTPGALDGLAIALKAAKRQQAKAAAEAAEGAAEPTEG